MAIQAHLVELERKHKSLENELHEALIHLSIFVSIPPSRFLMAFQAHLVELERKHIILEKSCTKLFSTFQQTTCK